MKPVLFLAVLLCLESCGFATKVDPRIAYIRQEHQQLLAKQQQIAKSGEQGNIARMGLQRLIQQSEAIQQALDQLDPSKSQEPAQVALVTELARQQAKLIEGSNAVDMMMEHTRISTSESITSGAQETTVTEGN
ncbi:hypothetical protein [Hymenobacter sp. YC55]|uniref:hypothetical protein n=1 Tax=Hymenobacter sp. YC55 TaxID=3034019 RepID=UPI0023FA3970|nr:hypothetical protein [Hymenobacter sp. YC55]MDF7812570.1 hypothetical protein [Hymenobacter sp. YC55]